MKRLLLIFCLIFAFSIALPASRRAPSSVYAQCNGNDSSTAGNCMCSDPSCATFEPSKQHTKTGPHKGDHGLPIDPGTGIGMVALMLLLWLRMR
jgi:hypothetical protein